MPRPRDRTSSLGDGTPHAAIGEAAHVHEGDLVPHRPVDVACVKEIAGGARIEAGNIGDHAMVLQLLVQTLQAPLAEDFQSRLDEPSYRASDRLLVRRGKLLVSHVRLAHHTAWFEGQRVPLVKFEDFASLPEFRHAAYDQELLRSAETIAASEGAVVALTRTSQPDWFSEHSWSPLRGQGHTRADARAVLAYLDAQSVSRRRGKKKAVSVETWRHFELDQVAALYEQTAPTLWGALFRSEPCWQWLVGRKAQDQILLAVDKQKAPDADDDGRSRGPVVGYAVIRGSCIVEMMTRSEFLGARTQLLARACQDAIDRDHHWISLYTPAVDPLHELLVTAGGAWIADATAGEPRWLMKLLAPDKWVERLYPVWQHRARAAGLVRPLEIGMAAGSEQFRFTLTRRSSRLARAATLADRHIRCDHPTFDSLLAGNLPIHLAIGRGQVRASHDDLAQALATIFAPRLFWQSPLETMRL